MWACASSVWAALILGCAACWSTTNVTGLFVTDVVVREGGLDIQRCELVHHEQHDLITIDALLGDEHTSGVTRRSWMDRCQWEAVELPVGISPPYRQPVVSPEDLDPPQVRP